MRQTNQAAVLDGNIMTAETYYPQAVLMWLETNQALQVSLRSIRLWRSVHQQMAPIVGDHGFMALYCRCIDLCGDQFSWLHNTPARNSAMQSFDVLGAQLAQQDGAEALEASRALFSMFYELLLLLVGEPLAASVIDAAWRDCLQHRRHDCTPAHPAIKLV